MFQLFTSINTYSLGCRMSSRQSPAQEAAVLEDWRQRGCHPACQAFAGGMASSPGQLTLNITVNPQPLGLLGATLVESWRLEDGLLLAIIDHRRSP